MKINKTLLTYIGITLFFILLILFTTITHTDELTNLIGTIIGIFIAYMIFDFIFVRFFKLSELKAVLFSFGLVLLFFIITAVSSSSPNSIYQLFIQIVISILLLILFFQFAKKDDEGKVRLLNLADDSNINLSQLSIISGKSEKKLKSLISRGVLSTVQTNGDEIIFIKGIALKELNSSA